MMITLVTAFGVTFLVWLVQYHWKRRRLYRVAAMHNGPIPLPLIGSALRFSGSNSKILDTAMELMVNYKSPITIWFGQRLFFIIMTPEHLEIVLNHPNALEKEDLYKHARPVLGLGLFTAPVPIWRKHRKLIMPTFNQKILNGFVEIFASQTEILLDQLSKEAGKGEFDVFSYFSLFALDSICETAMGIPIHAQTTNSNFVQWVTTFFKVSFNRMLVIWYNFDFIFNMTSMSKDFYESCQKLRKFTKDVVSKKKQEYQQRKLEKTIEMVLEEDSHKKNTFLDQFIELSEEGENLTDTEILDEVMTITVAGSDTTASINSFTLMMLAIHQEIQEKVYNEVIDVIGYDRPIEHTDLPNLPYTEMVIKETLRLFPAGPIIVRAITDDVTLSDGCVIPKNISVALGIIHVHRSPEYWQDPLKFDPLRFLPENSTKRHPYSYIPFSGGPRNCIGPKYAMMAIKATIAMVVRRYHMTTSYKKVEDIKLSQDMVLKPVEGHMISIKERNK